MNSRKPEAMVIDAKDNVAIAVRPLPPGETALVKTSSGNIIIKVRENIPPNHKFAIRDIKAGEHIVKFGEIIGAATDIIERGAHVHTQNVRSLHGRKLGSLS